VAEAVLIERSPGVVRATINRPDKRNAINHEVIAGLEAASASARDDGARVLVLRGAGETFCSGADLTHMSRLREEEPPGTEAFIERLAAVLAGFESAPFATLAAVEGYALAGGCEILLACDIVLARSDALIGDRHLEYALLPGAGGSVRLPRALSPARARYLLLTGEVIDGVKAAAWGLVTEALPPEAFEAAVGAVVERLRTRSADAIAMVKRILAETRDVDVDQAIGMERALVTEYRRSSPDGAEGLAAFRAKRAPTHGSNT
jgi:enoyl-CoA hydratase/carnithine racemase